LICELEHLEKIETGKTTIFEEKLARE